MAHQQRAKQDTERDSQDIGIIPVVDDRREATDILQTHDGIDVVVFDPQMPFLDGHALMAALQDVSPSSVIVIVTADSAVEFSHELGADAAFSKPFDPFMLASEVRRLVPIASPTD
jgi:CheY-like chemotaxis protein